MIRREEAILSRQNMSAYKTLYVEGDLDLNLINAYMRNAKIQSIRIYRIEDIDFENYDTQEPLGAKQRIIDFIKHSNKDGTIEKGKYLGIVDADFDFCFSEEETVDNLLYTDFNSMESYLIDIDLFKSFALDYKIDDLSYFETNLEAYMQNFIEFNICFLAQVRYYNEFNGNLITFDKVPLNCSPFIMQSSNYQISIDSVKNKINGCQTTWESIFDQKKQELFNLYDSCQSSLLHFLHGKHLLRYLMGICKNHYHNLKCISEDMMLNALKDKFIISLKYEQYTLFGEIKNFASE